eukprot:GAHX01000920.1.p1 GENE.GAHX01000920.1~~GAHX01000920.1.p1  ORF type:complete len:863 (-),score=189.74 GAHX01000920.1:37-2625(-)
MKYFYKFKIWMEPEIAISQAQELLKEHLFFDAVDLLYNENQVNQLDQFITTANAITISTYLRDKGILINHFTTGFKGFRLLVEEGKFSIYSNRLEMLVESFHLLLNKFLGKNTLTNFPKSVLMNTESLFDFDLMPSINANANPGLECQKDRLIMKFFENIAFVLCNTTNNLRFSLLKLLQAFAYYFPLQISEILNIQFAFNNTSSELGSPFNTIFKRINIKPNNSGNISEKTRAILTELEHIKNNKLIKTEDECFRYIIERVELSEPFDILSLSDPELNYTILTGLSNAPALRTVFESAISSNGTNNKSTNANFLGTLLNNALIHFAYHKDSWLTTDIPSEKIENKPEEFSFAVNALYNQLEQLDKHEAMSKIIAFGAINKSNGKLLPHILEMMGSEKDYIRVASLVCAAFIDRKESSIKVLLDDEVQKWTGDRLVLKLILLCYRTLGVTMDNFTFLFEWLRQTTDLDNKILILHTMFKIALFQNDGYPLIGHKTDIINESFNGKEIVAELTKDLNEIKNKGIDFTERQTAMLCGCDVLISTYDKKDLNSIFENFEENLTENIILKIPSIVSMFYNTGNIDMVHHLVSFLAKRKIDKNIKGPELDFAVISIALICANVKDEDLTKKMAIRMINLLYSEDTFLSPGIGPALGLLSLGVPETNLVSLANSLATSGENLGTTTAIGGVLGLGLLGFGTKNSKITENLINIEGIINSPVIGMAVKIALGFVHAGKGMFKIESNEATLKFLGSFVLKALICPDILLDEDFDTEVWDIFSLFRPKWKVAVDQNGKFVDGVQIRIGKEVGETGKKEIGGGLVMKTPLVVNVGESSEFVDSKCKEKGDTQKLINNDYNNIKTDIFFINTE